jgi:hypothetical protein
MMSQRSAGAVTRLPFIVAGLNGTLDETVVGLDRNPPSVPITRKSGPFALVGAKVLAFSVIPSALPSST